LRICFGFANILIRRQQPTNKGIKKMALSNAAKRRQAHFKSQRTASPVSNWQTPIRGTNADEFEIFSTFAVDKNGNDSTRNGAPMPTFDEWMNR
tara:strand:+ start:193 stop:474 length:282 start_codon:yes stop_codon:yes gene_type:complete